MEVYSIKYGESLFPKKYIYRERNQSQEDVEFLWLFYLAKLNNKVILFDTGFRDKYMLEKWGVSLKNYETELNLIINSFSDVDLVFITHSHFDHIGNLDLYKNATIIISKEEYDIANKEGEPAIRKRLSENNVIVVDDEYLYEETFLFKVIGGHSKGSSVIYFTHDSSTYVITGDECYVCENMLKTKPVGTYTDSEKNMQFLTNGYEKGMIPLPMHDVTIFANYESISENIVKIL